MQHDFEKKLANSTTEQEENFEAKYKAIGDVADVLNLPQHVLRFWETKFPQISPIKVNTRRYYKDTDVEIIKEIKHLLYDKGFTIKGVQNYLSDKKSKPNLVEASPSSNQNLDISGLLKLRENLVEAQADLEKIINEEV